MSHYRKFAIQTYRNVGESSARRIRAHPLPGQGVDTNLRVECSTKMRESHSVGTIFIIDAMLKYGRDDAPCLATHYNWPYEVVTLEQAQHHIASHFSAHRERKI